MLLLRAAGFVVCTETQTYSFCACPACTYKTHELNRRTLHELKEVQRGWLQYIRLASIHGKLKIVDFGCETASDIVYGPSTGGEEV